MPKAIRLVVALSVTVVLLAALGGLATGAGPATQTASAALVVTTQAQVGDPLAVDPKTGKLPEDPPYTRAEDIFNPQLAQAPVKDSVTWNPLFMSEFETVIDGDPTSSLFGQIFAGSRNATEKVWFRMWYEPWHWDKDWNANGTLDLIPELQIPYTLTKGTKYDEWYPAVMQEFTYMLLEAKQLKDDPQPLAGPVDRSQGGTSFVFPVGSSDFGDSPAGNGLDSLDADEDPTTPPDIVHVESELTLFELTKIAADFNGNGTIDNLDSDAVALNGNELAIFRLDSKPLTTGARVQFLDHYIKVLDVFDDSILIEIWYTGDLTPARLGTMTLYTGDMVLSGRNGPGQRIKAVANGGTGTNLCDFPTGPWFAYLETIDTAEYQARIIIGRALGATHTAMEESQGQPDLYPGDPWFLKRFYVDGHEYNVVALQTEEGAATTVPHVCTLDSNGDKEIDYTLYPPPHDPSFFKFITIRTPVPKADPEVMRFKGPLPEQTCTVEEWQKLEEHDGGYLIEQHSVRLEAYEAGVDEQLSLMAPFNQSHFVLLDVQVLADTSSNTLDCRTCITQTLHGYNCNEEGVPKFGRLLTITLPSKAHSYYYLPDVQPNLTGSLSCGRVLPPLQNSKNWQLLGELKEKYGEHAGDEFWYVEQFHSLPWDYTEFVLPNIRAFIPDPITDTAYITDGVYLLTSAWQAPQSQGALWTHEVVSPALYNMAWDAGEECYVRNEGVNTMPAGWKPRVTFWYDPSQTNPPWWKYKSDSGIRLYGLGDEGPGDASVKDPKAASYPVEVLPYTDPWAPFNPQLDQAPPKDSLTFNPAYMDKYNYSEGDVLADQGLYSQLSIREHDAREKVFLRMWYEPKYLDKYLVYDPKDPTPPFTRTAVYTFPAVMQEFTYMYLDTMDQPAHAQPGSSTFAFPIATGVDELPHPNALPMLSAGYGLTSFDADFDQLPDIVHLHSERSLNKITNLNADFNGDGMLNELDKDGVSLSGDELVVFALEDMVLHRGDCVQFLDHIITLDNVLTGAAELQFWYAGGGLHQVGGLYYSYPDKIGSPLKVSVNQMALANKSTRSVLPSTGNLGRVDGAWFVFVNAVNSRDETASVTVGRALGATHSAIDNGSGGHDLKPGDPWYLKRFFVDGHEYNVVALYTAPADYRNPGDELYEFKYITIRTPVPKVDFVNYEDSIYLQSYPPTEQGEPISVLPPFNSVHTEVEDVQAIPERTKQKVEPCCITGTVGFANSDLRNSDCAGDRFTYAVPPLTVYIVHEHSEPQFFAELKEMYVDTVDGNGVYTETWQTVQWRTLPDRFTELSLRTMPELDKEKQENYRYLLTSDWESEQSRTYFYGCDDISQGTLAGWNSGIPAANLTITGTEQTFFQAQEGQTTRVKFLYDPYDHEDIYVNRLGENNGSAFALQNGTTTLRVYGDGMHSVRKAPVPLPPVTPTPTATPTLVPTPTPTQTPIPGGTGVITGTARLQGRTVHSGILVSAGGRTGVTAADGKFTIGGLGAGSYLVRASAPGYLYADKAGVAVVNGAVTGLAPVQLFGGDCDGNCKVDLFDLVLVAINYGSQPPSDARADANGNGKVDIFDLVLVGTNMDKLCGTSWTAPSMVKAQAIEPAYLEVLPTHNKVVLNDVFTVTLALDEVTGLYGIDVQLGFAPGVLEVVDADPLTEGVQIHRGSFPNPTLGEVTVALADNEAGTARYVLTLLSPAEPASGSGDLCYIVFRAKAEGFSSLTISSAALVDKDAGPLSVVTYDGSVQVSPKSVYMPLGYKNEQR